MKNLVKCIFCGNKYTTKKALYTHIENKHGEQIPKGMSAAQFYFNNKYNKTHGSCIMCKKSTKWNEKSGKYDRLCEREVCSKNFRDMFKKRMMKVHGKTTLLDSPEVQKKMLSKRRISGKYKWNDGTETEYVGSYEKNFLQYMENIISWKNPKDVLMPCPFTLNYVVDGKEHFYIPDVFIPSLNLILEIKASSKNNKHSFRQRESISEKAKDEVAMKSPYTYIKVEDNNFSELSTFLSNVDFE